MDAIADFLARGGTITKCPPAYAAHGWTPHKPDLGGPDSTACRPADFNPDGPKVKDARANGWKKTMEANARRRAESMEKYAQVVELRRAGKTFHEIKDILRCGKDTVRNALRAVGLE